MNKKTHKKMLVGGVVATLSFLPGCIDTFKGGNDQTPIETRTTQDSRAPMTGEVLVFMKGEPAITTDSLEKEKEKLLKANPQLKQALAFMNSREVDRNILEGLVSQIVVDEYIAENKINETAAYQAELKDLCESMERMLNSKFFSERKSVIVPEVEVRSFYDLNKDKIQGLTLSQGGVAATGIEFADGAAARAFAARAKTAPGGFKKVAQDDGLTAKMRDFKLVNNQSIGIDEQLRDKIAAIKIVPSIDILEANGMFWVIHATSKEEPKYIPYEQIKDRLKEKLEQEKRVELFTKEIDGLKKDYAIEIKEDYFRPEAAPQEMAARGGEMAHQAEKKETVEKRLA